MKRIYYLLIILVFIFSCDAEKEKFKYFNDDLYEEWHKEVINFLETNQKNDSCKKYLKEEFIAINAFNKRSISLDTVLKKYASSINSINKFKVSESVFINKSTYAIRVQFNNDSVFYDSGLLGKDITYVSSNKRILNDNSPCKELNCKDFNIDGLISIDTKFERENLNQNFNIKETCVSFVARDNLD